MHVANPGFGHRLIFLTSGCRPLIYGTKNPGNDWIPITIICGLFFSIFNLDLKNHNIHIDYINISLDNI